MLSEAMKFITDQLSEFLKRKTLASHSVVKLSGLVTPEGGISVTDSNTLVISVVNIAEEGSIANQPHINRHNSKLIKQTPPVYLNVYVLISALFKEDQYSVGLQWLSLAINFFQQHPFFDSKSTSMPKGIDKLSFELVNLDIDNMSRFWGALGARYQPSIIYKMRMLKFSGASIEAVVPEFKTPKINSKN